MTAPPLHDRFESPAASEGKEAGSSTARPAPAEEFRHLREGCGIYPLSESRISVSGKDRMRWLNGMITNNIRDLAPGCGTYNFVLTPQGRIQGDLYAYHRGDSLLLELERDQAERLLELLKKHIIMDQVELRDISGEAAGLAAQGPKAEAWLRAAAVEAIPLEPLQIQDVAWRGAQLTLIRLAAEVADGFEIWGKPADVAAMREALRQAGAVPVGAEALEMYRIARGIPRYGVDIRDRDLPQETGQMRALNFTKGCYIGQEIVERIRSRGAVHRALAGFQVEGDPPPPGAKALVEGKEVGEITSAARIPAPGGARTLALGFLRREHSAPGTAVEIGGSRATVRPLPGEFR